MSGAGRPGRGSGGSFFQPPLAPAGMARRRRRGRSDAPLPDPVLVTLLAATLLGELAVTAGLLGGSPLLARVLLGVAALALVPLALALGLVHSRHAYVAAGLLATPLVVLYAYTGVLLVRPRYQLLLWFVQVTTDPLPDPVASMLLADAARLHYAVAWLGVAVLVLLALRAGWWVVRSSG